MRVEGTPAEVLVWRALRGRQIGGCKFRRQVPLGGYILDFVSFEARLVIEIDGATHADPAADEARDTWLGREGFRVLRFWNNEVMGHLDGVLQRVDEAVEAPCGGGG